MSNQRNKIAFVSHCILNQATRAEWAGGKARRETGMLRNVVEIFLDNGIGAIQLDCPEFNLYGNPRQPRSKDGYDTPIFIDHCREIAVGACDLMERYINGETPSSIVAIVGVENSPSCGINNVTRTVNGEDKHLPGKGHLMEALEAEMLCRGIDIPMIGVSLNHEKQKEELFKFKRNLGYS